MQQIWDLLDKAKQIQLPQPLQDELVDRVQEISWQFLITPIPQHHCHYHYPLLYFTGVLGIHPQNLAYRTPYQFTPILAGLLWVSRILILEYNQQPASATHVILPSSSGSGSNFDTEHFRCIQSRYLCRESISGISYILRFLAYERQLASNEGPRTNISWAPDSQALTLFSSQNPDSGRQMIQLANFRKMVGEAIRHCHYLTYEMMLGWEPLVDLDFPRDDLTNTPPSYSFLSNPANQLQEAFKKLLRRAWDGDLQAKGQWQWQRCHHYIRQLDQLQLQLLLCSHFTSGMPARGSKLHVLKWQNTRQVMRNIFIHQGQVHLIFEYIKTRAITNNSFYIVRVLPPSIGKLWFLYLTYIRPFVNCLRYSRDNPYYYSLSPLDQPQQAYTFLNKHNQPYSTQQLSDTIARSSQEHYGQRLTTASYRQVVAAIAKRHIKELVTTATATADPAFTSIAHQFGHQPQVLDTGYGLDRNYPAKLQPELIAQYRRVSASWHQWLQLELEPGYPNGVAVQLVASTPASMPVREPEPVAAAPVAVAPLAVMAADTTRIRLPVKRKAEALSGSSSSNGNKSTTRRLPWAQIPHVKKRNAAAISDSNT